MRGRRRPGEGDGSHVDPARRPREPTDIADTSQRVRRVKQLACAARWKAEHPREIWAQAALASAIKRGLIERKPCEICGKAEVDGHHHDYDQPLAVRWLCRRHHRQLHAELRKRGKHG